MNDDYESKYSYLDQCAEARDIINDHPRTRKEERKTDADLEKFRREEGKKEFQRLRRAARRHKKKEEWT